MWAAAFIFIIVFFCFDNGNCVEAQPQPQQAQQVLSSITQTSTTLSEARTGLAATSSGELVFFGGGQNATGPSNRVDICNVTSGMWTTATLSIPRANLAATSSGALVFFGGGWNGSSSLYNQVDIYNMSDGSWSTATLSQARCCLAATSVGSLVLFGGGQNSSTYSNVVDVYNVTNNTWTTATLSNNRAWLAATSVANRYAIFAGGLVWTTYFDTVDIYDSQSEIWSTATLSQARGGLAAASLGNLAFFGGGNTNGSAQTSNIVDIFNATSLTWNTATLSQARSFLAAASFGEIVIFGGGGINSSVCYSVVDVFNVTANIWLTMSLSVAVLCLAATSSKNKIFFGGGSGTNGNVTIVSNVVDIFTISPSSQNEPSLATPPKQSDYISTGVIVGIIVGIITILIGIGVILFLILFMKRRKRQKKCNQRQIASTPLENQKSASSTPTQTETTENPLKSPQTMLTFHEILEATQSTSRETLIAFNEITVEKKIGSGNYGSVYLAKWNQAHVALKFCQQKGNFEEFMKEMKLMFRQLPLHPNVVHLCGVSIDDSQPVIILEYCAGGSLDRLLYDTNEKLSEKRKIFLIEGIAAGMYHLHKHNIVHRDLAARNILLTSGGDPKISDFGLSRILEQVDEGKTKCKIGPVCWMAPESIGQQVYSKKSDVWMFGILVYEIVVQSKPHSGQNPKRVGALIRDQGLTPKIPEDCPPKLRELMEMCWKKQPDQRPSFETICEFLEQLEH